jgi:hypothetical protein
LLIFCHVTDSIVAGDCNGSGFEKNCLFRCVIWYLDYNGNGIWDECGTTPDKDKCLAFGQGGDLPVAGDWNGDGISKIGVFRNGMWYMDFNGNGLWDGCGSTPDTDRCLSFGMSGDSPVAGNW